MTGRTDRVDSDDFRREQAPELHVVRPCPLCNELMEFDPQSSPQVVVCDSCGLACTIDVPQPRATTLELDAFAAAPPAAEEGDAVVQWLGRSPGPILPAPDFAAKQASARRRQLMMAGGVAGSAAMAISLMSGYFGYHRASDKLALQQQTAESRQQAATQKFLLTKQRLEQERLDAESKQIAAQRDVRAVTAKYLAAQSQELATQPWQSVILSTQAVRSTLAVDGLVVVEAHQSLRDSLHRCSASHDVDAIELRGHAGPITTIAISPDGRWLATGSNDRTARVWDLQADHPQRTAVALNVHQKPLSSLLFTSDGQWLVSGSRDATACLWSIADGAPAVIPTILPGRGQPISQMAVSPSGDWLAAVSTEAGVEKGLGQLWNLAAGPNGIASMALTGHAGQIQAMAISPDSRWLALGVDDVVKLWDLAARDPAAASLERQCRHGNVTATLFTGDGKWLVTCGAGREPAVRLWNLASQDHSDSMLLKGLDGPVRAATVSADSRYLVAAGNDRRLRVWTLPGINSASEPAILDAGDAAITAIAMSKSGEWLAASGAAGQVRLWRVSAAGVEPQPVVLTASEKAINTIAFTADGGWLVAAGDDWTARLWNLDIDQLAARADAVATLQIDAQRVAQPSLLDEAIDAIGPREIAEATAPGILWSTIRWHAPRLQSSWQEWLNEQFTEPVEPQIATGPRTNEVGDVEMPPVDPLAAAPVVEPAITPTEQPLVPEKPSLMVAMPEADPAAQRPPMKHEWPVRSIVKRPVEGEGEPRTAAKPASTLEIHTR